MATQKPTSSLKLTRTEVTFCKKLAGGDGLNSQRARALLAIHDGGTQANAAEISGLTVGQVRYMVGRFRLHRVEALKVVPQASVAKVTVEDTPATTKPKKKKDKAKTKAKDKDKKVKKEKTKTKDKKKNKSDKKSMKDKKKKSKK